MKEKHEQHSSVLEHLTNLGYADVQLHGLIFGSIGGMFKLAALHLKQLEIPQSKVGGFYKIFVGELSRDLNLNLDLGHAARRLERD